MPEKDYCNFARKKFASPVSESTFYSLKENEVKNPIESLMCNIVSIAGASFL